MIVAAELCVTSVQLNWFHYLLNELLAYAEEAQEKGSTFRYSWLLILIVFVAWEEPTKYQGVDVPMPCKGTIYYNIWFDRENPQRRKETILSFISKTKQFGILLSHDHK